MSGEVSGLYNDRGTDRHLPPYHCWRNVRMKERRWGRVQGGAPMKLLRKIASSRA